MFHAWSTVLREQVGGLRRILLSSSSGFEEREVTRGEDGNTNLGYDNSSTCSAASYEEQDESDGTSDKVTAVHDIDDDHCGSGNSTDYNCDDSIEVSSSTTKTLWIHPYLA